MNREERLVRNTFIYIVGNFVSKFLGFILLPFYTHYLSVNDYGYYDIVTTTISLILPLVTLQITESVYLYVLESKNEEEQCQVISTTIYNLIKYLLIFNILYLLTIHFIKIKYEYLILLQIDITIFSTTWMQICRALRKNLLYSISGIVSTFVILVANIILIIVFKMKADALIVSNILSVFAVFVFLELKLKIISKIRIKAYNEKIKKDLLKYSIPLIPTGISWWLMNVSDRYLLTYFLGVDANGIYAIANKLPIIIVTFNNFFQNAWVESAVSEYNSEDRDVFFSAMFDRFMKFQLSLCGVLICFNKFIMNFLVDPKFYIAWRYMPCLYLAAVFTGFSAFAGVGYRCSKKTIGEFYTTLVGSGLNLIINIICIPLIGIQAAAISTMVSYFITWILRAIDTKKYYRIKIDYKILIAQIILMGYFIFIYYNENKILMYANMVISSIIFILYNRNMIKAMVYKIKNKFNIGIRH